MRFGRWLFLSGIALLILPSSSPAAPARGTKVFCWKVTSPTTEAYLLGSVHVGTKEMYPLPKVIEEAFDRSKYLVLEIDLSKIDAPKLQQLMFEKGMYADGDDLSKHLSAETLKSVQGLAEGLGLQAGIIDKMKPWLLAMTLTELEIQKLGYAADLGIDQHFATEAKEKSKEILQVESMEFQLQLLSGLSDDLQVKFLASTVEEAQKAKEQMALILRAWGQGDASLIEEEMIRKPREKHPDQAEFQTKLIDERNVGMARKIAGYLKTSDPHFVVVGAAHLVGEKGVVKLLEKEGFKVEQLEAP